MGLEGKTQGRGLAGRACRVDRVVDTGSGSEGALRVFFGCPQGCLGAQPLGSTFSVLYGYERGVVVSVVMNVVLLWL